jgi:hypothetical protein
MAAAGIPPDIPESNDIASSEPSTSFASHPSVYEASAKAELTYT